MKRSSFFLHFVFIVTSLCLPFLKAYSSQAKLQQIQEQGVQDLSVICITQYPTTSFVGFSKDGKIEFQLVNSNGVQFMPIYSGGLVTSHDLETLKKNAAALKRLGDGGTFSFDLEKCSLDEAGIFNCYGNSTFKDANEQEISDIKVISLGSSRSEVTTIGGFKYQNIRLLAGFEIQRESYYVAMDYSPEECQIFNPLKAKK